MRACTSTCKTERYSQLSGSTCRREACEQNACVHMCTSNLRSRCNRTPGHACAHVNTHPGGWTLGPAGDWVATHSFRNACRAHKQFAASQSFNSPKPSNVRPSIIIAARSRMTEIEPSSDRHGSCSLHRYTTLKIVGAAHKLSTSRNSEHTFGRCQVLVTHWQ